MPGVVSDGGVTASNRSSGTIGHRRWRYLGHPTQLKVGINDAEGFQHFKTALRKLTFPQEQIEEICQILATILHIGQLEFMTSQTTTPAADESGGYSHEGGEDVTVVKNKDVLGIIAAFLGLSASDLEVSLGYKTKSIHRERVTVLLDPKGARANADELARTLYSLLVAYVMERINQKICANENSVANTISIVDFPGFEQTSATGSALDQLLNNAAAESLYNLCLQNFFESKADLLETEEVSVPATSYFDNTDAARGLLKPGNGLLSILDDQTRRGRTDMQLLESLRKRFENRNPAIVANSATTVLPGSNFATRNPAAIFTVKHFAGEVEYSVEGLVEENGEVVAGDMMNLINSTKSDFVRELFGQEALRRVMHPKEKTAVLQAQVSSKPLRMPSLARRRGTKPAETKPIDNDSDDAASQATENTRRKKGNNKVAGIEQGASGQFLVSLENIKKSITAQNTNSYYVFCLKPNDRRIANQFDSKCVRTQIQIYGIAEISQRLRTADFSLFLPFGEFIGLTNSESILIGSEREKAEVVLTEKGWPNNEARLGATGVFLSERCWASIAQLSEKGALPSRYLGTNRFEDDERDFHDSRSKLVPSNEPTPSPGAYYDDNGKQDGYFGKRELDTRSDTGDLFRHHETREQMAEKGNEKHLVEVEDVVVSGSRKRWLALVWMLTWWVPDLLIKHLGRIPRKEIRTAWREKFAINLLIWFSCGFVIFFIVVFPQLICPKQNVFSASELAAHNGKGTTSYVAIRGVVFNLGKFMPNHYPSIVPQTSLAKYAGLDATDLFPVQVSSLCRGQGGTGIDPTVALDATPVNITGSVAVIGISDPNSKYHDFRYSTNDSRLDWWQEQMIMLRANYKEGYVGYTPSYVAQLASQQMSIATLNGKVYDFTNYVKGMISIQPAPGQAAPSDVNKLFMDPLVVDLFQQNAGTDVTKMWEALPISSSERSDMQLCLDNLFFVGASDTRNSTQCLFAQYVLLAVSILLVSVIGFKFFAALQFGRKNVPENLDKFVICQIPAYTEDEESLRRAIDSAARMKYDDKRKLLVIICDGMIIGQGNDRPTPRIVLDILGVSETVDPEPLSFESLGEGMKQHNMGKVYSGLYEVQGHIVPFLVVVKIGKPSEVSRPGNRGKRDSQMLLMRFLNRVHYNAPMNPLELEMHHQIRNIIGVNPTFYEFMFQIDADTVVAADSATRMVAAFLQDSRLIGICGETALTNAKASFITMIQVYEYYISHNLTKAFESLFGSVTCLPGCFSMYRIRAAETGKPLFVSREIVEAYANIRVDTLHMKNLLHLGEDRYLTTLLLKYHSKYKTKYTFHAHAWTIAPDSWKIFMSQRRRWINSTVHNLIELIPIQQLCGFCCFSMRFVVFLDLLSTIVQPVTVAYIVYLIVLISINASVVPLTAFILLGAIYGLQAIIFILRRKWEMVGWMIVYIIAMPVFSLGLPLYAFWHMDDFSWGNTRVVTGEKGKKIVVTDEGKFTPDMIPRKKWEEYQQELWEAQSQHDDMRSEYSGISYGTRSMHLGAASEYGVPRSAAASIYHPTLDPRMSSRYSLGASEMLGGAGTAGYQGQEGVEMHDLVELGGPSDDQLLAEIRDILRTADLMSFTKKSLHAELERRFGVNLEYRRQYIGSGKSFFLRCMIDEGDRANLSCSD
jgi:chitin synthase